MKSLATGEADVGLQQGPLHQVQPVAHVRLGQPAASAQGPERREHVFLERLEHNGTESLLCGIPYITGNRSRLAMPRPRKGPHCPPELGAATSHVAGITTPSGGLCRASLARRKRPYKARLWVMVHPGEASPGSRKAHSGAVGGQCRRALRRRRPRPVRPCRGQRPRRANPRRRASSPALDA